MLRKQLITSLLLQSANFGEAGHFDPCADKALLSESRRTDKRFVATLDWLIYRSTAVVDRWKMSSLRPTNERYSRQGHRLVTLETDNRTLLTKKM